MAAAGCEAAAAADHEALHLARPVFEVLDHPAILRFRKLHRLGYAKGAKGEVGAALRKVAEKQQQQQQQQQQGVGPHTSLPEGISGNEAANLLSPFAAYAADSPFATDEALLAQIARWRMAYQNFRGFRV
ncbi:Mannitol-1-phosphate dehydrogenase, related [Eimeria necatrix]|uniref:Mannitol-1-phosphate dehydrogenase, related n=1 Tax=Eimeria necatrix TaxID=51315 RepID=U6MNT2_9EIME|nr:Mannitol-1-phosphate dehydrogenase, related [Eimeria necatrix]CDJ64109.1 Mannitol-1-phosphate dehydrogenase, related [Eimeria necatrix]